MLHGSFGLVPVQDLCAAGTNAQRIGLRFFPVVRSHGKVTVRGTGSMSSEPITDKLLTLSGWFLDFVRPTANQMKSRLTI
ncbi:MAG: hypothetical protein DMG97_43260 [Acidobacteria bacterium]|nr:MAG: hypothetical protein DMG97_43260 [Acidobacteriota bacterium]